MAETELPQHDPFANASRHVLGRLGLGFEPIDDGDAGPARVTLELHPVLLDDRGHVSLGALGVLFDMACSTALDPSEFVPFVHADITVHRLRPPRGPMVATAGLVRRGRRRAVAVIDLHDDTGELVAASTQEVVFREPRPEATPEMARMRESFRSMFDGVCRLAQPLEHELAVTEDPAGTWRMELGQDRTNGFGGLHGGVATTLIDVAAAGAVQRSRGRPAHTTSVATRYLAPALGSPFTVTPQLLADDGTTASLRAPVLDAAGELVILADVQVA